MTHFVLFRYRNYYFYCAEFQQQFQLIFYGLSLYYLKATLEVEEIIVERFIFIIILFHIYFDNTLLFRSRTTKRVIHHKSFSMLSHFTFSSEVSNSNFIT